MRKFDFKHPDFKKNGKERQKYYRASHAKPVTEAEFIAEVSSWPPKDKRNSKSRGPAASRHRYRYLVRNYGFFPGGQDA